MVNDKAFFKVNKISIIMPAYNAEKFIEDAVESILNQTYSNFELLICDDGSTDNTVKIIESFSDDRIFLFKNNQNIGNLETTNFLFRKCKGDYITIQDADDFSFPNRLEILLNQFSEDTTLGMVGSNYEIVDEDKTPISCGFLPITNDEIKERMKKEIIPMLYASVLIKKEILDSVGVFKTFFNRRGFADMDWLSRCAENTKVKNCKEILYSYRKHSTSFNSSLEKKKSRTRLDIIFEHMHLLLLNAYEMRKNSLNDYFEDSDIKSMSSFLSNYYIKKAENEFWIKNRFNSFKMLQKAFWFDPRNKLVRKTFFYIFRKTLFLKNK